MRCIVHLKVVQNVQFAIPKYSSLKTESLILSMFRELWNARIVWGLDFVLRGLIRNVHRSK